MQLREGLELSDAVSAARLTRRRGRWDDLGERLPQPVKLAFRDQASRSNAFELSVRRKGRLGEHSGGHLRYRGVGEGLAPPRKRRGDHVAQLRLRRIAPAEDQL